MSENPDSNSNANADSNRDETDDGADGDATATPADVPPGEEAPLSDLARDVERRRRRAKHETDEDPDLAELFTEVEVGEVDSEAVWETVTETTDDEETDEFAASTTELLVESSAADPVEGAPGEFVVPKSAFCQRCRYFSEPPAFGCSHPGTDIVEVVDADHFRVRECPMVEDESPLRE